MTRFAYLVSEYPAPSHTFIRREIAALRRRGLTIMTFSVRSSLRSSQEEVQSIQGLGWWRCLTQAVRTLASAPWRSGQTWLLAQSHRVPGLRGLVWAQFHWVEALALASMLKRAGVDHLHSHFANSGATVGMLAAHCLRIPWSLTLHGISETDYPAGILLSEKLLRAQFVACASWFMRAQAMRLTPVEHWSKYQVVRCGIEVRPRPQVAYRSTTDVRLVAVGRLSAEKGYPGLISAFADLLERGVDASLTIVGGGPLRSELEHYIQGKGVAERVSLRGALPEEATLEEIEKADILVLPSLMEGLPVVLIEAMGLGKPVIAPTVAGIPELIRDGETGLLFSPSNWSNLSDCMFRLCTDGLTCKRLGARARTRVCREFDVDVAVRPLLRLFAESSSNKFGHE